MPSLVSIAVPCLGVASNLEKKSQENARKMSSLVGMAGERSLAFNAPRSADSISSRKCNDSDRCWNRCD